MIFVLCAAALCAGLLSPALAAGATSMVETPAVADRSCTDGPRDDAARSPLRYPFESYDGRVEFVRQRTGERVFDLNADGVAHYGLVADLLADMQRSGRAKRALPKLFGSAEAYLQMWERAARR